MLLIKAKQDYIDQALRMIADFERDVFGRYGNRRAFTNLQPRLSIARGLRERVNDPKTIDQNQGSLCGPAAFCYCLLNTRPHLYVAYVIDLYTEGVGRINDLVVRPGKGCREFVSDSSQIADVDWIALASLRDSTNSDLAYSSPDKEYAGITMPHDMVSWFRKAGFVSVMDRTNIVVGKKIETLLEANIQLLAARFVCLFVNANLIDFGDYLGFGGVPNHWVVLDAPVSKCQPDDVRFSVYSYGKTMDAPPHGRRLEQIDLPKYFFGYVSAGPY
jgi:hypothetical protein